MSDAHINRDNLHRHLNSNGSRLQLKLKEIAEAIAEEAKKNAVVQPGHFGTGELSRSINAHRTSEATESGGTSSGTIPVHGWRITADNDHAAATEFGVGPHRVHPPYDSNSRLYRWMGVAKGGSPRNAFKLAAVIWDQGIKPKHYMRKAINEVLRRQKNARLLPEND